LAFSAILIFGALRSTRVLYSMRVAIDAFIIPFLAYYATKRLITSEYRLRRLIQVVVAMGCLNILVALLERLTIVGGYGRLGAIFGEPGPLSFVMAMIFLIMLADSLRNRSLLNEKRIFSGGVRWFALTLAPVISLLTWARSNWFAFLMGFGTFLFLARRLTDRPRQLAFIGLTLIFLALTPVAIQAPQAQQVLEERVTGRTGTVYARLGAWQVILEETTKPSVLFGIGLNELRAVLGTTRIEFMGKKSETSSHNSFLSLLAELGVIGLLVYLALIATIVRFGLRLYRLAPNLRGRIQGIMLVGITVAYLMPAFFANTLYLKQLSNVYFYVIVGGMIGVYGENLSILARYRFRRRQQRVGVPALTFGT
jgi:O-antigen ligase